MFKKTKIAAAILAAAAATSAQAVHVNPNGTGQVAVLPYYNVNNNFVTNVTITNTTADYKAVKVRFRESGESNDVLDFNIYMSPFDQWSGSIGLNDSGLAQILTTDSSCTYPDSVRRNGGSQFVGGNVYESVSLADTLEGYLEVIEMGVIAVDAETAEVAPSGTLSADSAERWVRDGVKHVNGVPADCSVIEDAWANGGFTSGDLAAGVATDDDVSPDNGLYDGTDTKLNNGLDAPTGGLSTYGILLNGATGAAFVMEATHMNNYSTFAQHYRSDDLLNFLLPSLASGDVADGEVFLSDDSAGATAATITPNPMPPTIVDTSEFMDLTTQDGIPAFDEDVVAGANPFPVAVALNTSGVQTQYFVDDSIGAATDVVLTMPMRKHGVYNGMQLTYDGTGLTADLTVPDDIKNNVAGAATPPWAYEADGTTGDVVITVAYRDGEESLFTPVGDEPIVSPPIPGSVTSTVLDREVNVVSFIQKGGSTSAILGTPAAVVTEIELEDGYTGGFASITPDSEYDMSTHPGLGSHVSGDPAMLPGLPAIVGAPMIGFTAISAGAFGETIELIRDVGPVDATEATLGAPRP